MICKDCIILQAKEQYAETQLVPCPQCQKYLNNEELKVALGDMFDAITNANQEIDGVIRCDCGNAFVVDFGDVDYKVKDDMGNFLSKQAAEHYAKCRIRCSACEKNFCSKCKISPYHIGFTCEELKRHKEAVKC